MPSMVAAPSLVARPSSSRMGVVSSTAVARSAASSGGSSGTRYSLAKSCKVVSQLASLALPERQKASATPSRRTKAGAASGTASRRAMAARPRWPAVGMRALGASVMAILRVVRDRVAAVGRVSSLLSTVATPGKERKCHAGIISITGCYAGARVSARGFRRAYLDETQRQQEGEDRRQGGGALDQGHGGRHGRPADAAIEAGSVRQQ